MRIGASGTGFSFGEHFDLNRVPAVPDKYNGQVERTSGISKIKETNEINQWKRSVEWVREIH